MPRVVHFDIMAKDPERAIAFYQEVFGWKFEKWDSSSMDYWLISTGPEDEPGIDGGMGVSEGEIVTPEEAINTIGTEAIDEHIAKIEAHGGTIVRPKGPIPGVGWIAYFEGPEGNRFGLMEDDPEAR